MKVRIGQQGVGEGSTAPETAEDVLVGMKLMWVELNGHRFEDITEASFVARRDGVSTPLLMVEVIGSVEIVYTDRHGEPLPGRFQTATVEALEELSPIGADTAMQRPAPLPPPEDPGAARLLAEIERGGHPEHPTFFVEGLLYATENGDGEWPVEWNYPNSGQVAYRARTAGEAAAYVAGFEAAHVMRQTAPPSPVRSDYMGS